MSILDTIDGALAGCAASADAMRWVPGEQRGPYPGTEAASAAEVERVRREIAAAVAAGGGTVFLRPAVYPLR